jgi:protein-glutamine gamma-glutamyltransferase
MNLEIAAALKLATYLLVADGLAALYLGDLLGPVGVAVVSLAVVATWWQERLRVSLRRVGRGETVPALLAGAASVLDLVYFAQSMLDGLVHLLLFLLLYRLFTRTTLRDARDVGFLGFFMLVAAAPVTFDVGFLFVFVGFLVIVTWMLVLRHVLMEMEAGGALTPPAVPGSRLLALSVTAAMATLGITVLLFFLVPRIGQAALPLRAKVGRMVSGFSERVALGSFGDIEADSTVVMRVHLPDGSPEPETLAPLRWRGIALDHFDGRVWTRDDADRLTLRRAPGGSFELAHLRGAGLLLAQEIYLEPIGSEVIFGAPRMWRLRARSDTVTVDEAGAVWVASAAARLRYDVESELEGSPSRRALVRREPLDPRAQARYLQLPDLSSRVGELAATVTGGSRDQFEAALRLTDYLATQYRYTRALERTTDLPPVEEFLFSSRRGNCEYFAASLAVMLRALGIPARVVNGFQRGEWNPYGRYFIVRLLDAHSWVEAHVDGAAWVALDPSPRGGSEAFAARGSVNLYLDALRMRWYRDVVNWSLQDQMLAAGKVRRAASSWTVSFGWLRRATTLPWRALALAALAAILVGVAWRWRPRLSGAATQRPLPRFYARALRALARRRFRPTPAETAREFAARVAASLPASAEPFAKLTAGYERVRFAGAPLTSEELAALDACVEALARSGAR